jgi:Homeodomain-like domain
VLTVAPAQFDGIVTTPSPTYGYVITHAAKGWARVVERRRAVALARHYREVEGLSIAQIADRLGRSPATVKAYFYDPSDANKGPSWEREAEAGDRELPESPDRRGTKSGNPSPTDLFCAGLAVQHVR